MDRPTTPHKIGDRVRVNCPRSMNHGDVTEVISDLHLVTDFNGTYWVHDVDLPNVSGFRYAGFEPHELIPIYDGNQKVSWESCEWQPKGVTCE